MSRGGDQEREYLPLPLDTAMDLKERGLGPRFLYPKSEKWERQTKASEQRARWRKEHCQSRPPAAGTVKKAIATARSSETHRKKRGQVSITLPHVSIQHKDVPE